MAIGLLGRKVGMTQIFDESGNVVPVTVIEAGPCHVLQLRTSDRDGYEAVQLGFLDKPRRLASRSQRGHVAKLDSKRSKARAKAGVEPLPKPDCEPQRFVRELRGSTEGLTVGQTLDVTTSLKSSTSTWWARRAAAPQASWSAITFKASGPRTA
jgi:large subunit ribosomal protein L3